MPGVANGEKGGSTNRFVWTTTKAMRRHIIERLKLNNPFTLGESKLALKHLCKLIVREARRDFEQIFELDEMYRDTVLPKLLQMYDADGDGILTKEELAQSEVRPPVLTAWDIPKLATFPDAIKPLMEQLEQADENDPSAQLQCNIFNVHKNMLQIISINQVQHTDRVMVMRSLIQQLEDVGATR